MDPNVITTVLMLAIVAVMYLVVFLPQRKKEKQLAVIRKTIEIGDIVVTQGGLVGKVIKNKDDGTVTIEVGADKTKLPVKRWAILSKETAE